MRLNRWRRDKGEVESEILTPQHMAVNLIDAFAEHDRAGLTGLDLHERQRQLHAREALLEYVEALWGQTRARGEQPADELEREAVAGMRDLVEFLHETACQAVYETEVE